MANPHPVSRKNKPNKASTTRIERALQQGRRLPHDALLLIAERALATAAKFQPGTETDPNPQADLKEFSHWLDRAREASKTETGTDSGTPVPEPAIKEDDADGVAA